ncbi:MAG: hypothetical protein J6Q78_07025 [Clostridia bacterium]|nr:hypothetical protein [Clostridia bacterium]
MVSLIFALAIFAFIALAGFYGYKKGHKFIWHYSLAKVVLFLVSAIVSVILAKLLSKLIVNPIVSAMPTDTVGGMSDIVSALILMIITPFVFYPVFVIIKVIAYRFISMLAGLIVKLFKHEDKLNDVSDFEGKKRQKNMMRFRADGPNVLGGAIGAVCSILVLCAFFAPMVGTFYVVDGALNVVEAITPEESKGNMESLFDTTDALSNNAGSITVRILGGDIIYSSLSSTKIDGERASLKKEIVFLNDIAKGIGDISSDSISDSEKADSFRGITDHMDDSVILPSFLSSFISEAAGEWKNGNDYMGVSFLSVEGEAFEKFFEALEESNTQTIKEDMGTIINVIAISLEEGMFGSMADDPAAIFENEEVSSDILYEILKNERLSPLAGGFTSMGIGVMGDSLEMPANNDELYARFISGVSGAYNSSVGNGATTLPTDLVRSFDKGGIRINTPIAETIAADMQSRFGSNYIYDIDVQNYFMENSVKVIVDSEAGKTEKAYLGNKEEFLSYTEALVVSDVKLDSSNVTSPEEEADDLAAAIHSVINVMDMTEDEDYEAYNMVAELGPILDSFAATETIGKKNAEYLLVLILQSENISSNVGFKLCEATDIAATINEGTDTDSYTVLMKSFSSTVKAISAASSDEKDTSAAVREMMADLTPASAKAIQKTSTPDMVMNHGVSEQSSVPVSGMVSHMFGNLGEAKAKGMSDEQYEREADAVSDLMNVAMSATSNDDKPVFGKGGNSKTGITATEYVSRVMNSDVVSDTMVHTAYDGSGNEVDNPLNSERKLSEAETTELVGALNAEWNASSDKESDEKTLKSIASVLNVKVELTDSGFVLAE